MGRSKGYFLLWRSIEDDPLYFAEPFTKAQAWIDLIGMANYKERSFLLGSEEIHAEIGSVITSELKLMSRWQWSKEKVRSFLKFLERRGSIERRPDRKKTVIILRNYEEYQTAFIPNDVRNNSQIHTTQETAENPLFSKCNGNGETTSQTSYRPPTDRAETADHTQTIKENTLNALKTERKDLPSRQQYGMYENVLLSDDELQKLKSEFPEDAVINKIDRLSEYMMQTGKSYANHSATLRSWLSKDLNKQGGSNDFSRGNTSTCGNRSDDFQKTRTVNDARGSDKKSNLYGNSSGMANGQETQGAVSVYGGPEWKRELFRSVEEDSREEKKGDDS